MNGYLGIVSVNKQLDQLASEIIIEVLEEITKRGDYFIVDCAIQAVLYSRHYNGGAYEIAFRYQLHDDGIMCVRNVRVLKSIIVNIASPDSFEQIGKAIKMIINEMQNDRQDHGSPGGIEVRRKYK